MAGMAAMGLAHGSATRAISATSAAAAKRAAPASAASVNRNSTGARSADAAVGNVSRTNEVGAVRVASASTQSEAVAVMMEARASLRIEAGVVKTLDLNHSASAGR